MRTKSLQRFLRSQQAPENPEGHPQKLGNENWRKAIKDYEQILAEFDRDSVKKAS